MDLHCMQQCFKQQCFAIYSVFNIANRVYISKYDSVWRHCNYKKGEDIIMHAQKCAQLVLYNLTYW